MESMDLADAEKLNLVVKNKADSASKKWVNKLDVLI